MTQLVYIENGKTVTDSLTVAETFGKRHADVMRSIVHMECSAEFTERNFALSTYADPSGRSLPRYIITQDGFSFLAMGFTGKEAARFKEMYIREFGRMAQLNKPAAGGVQAILQATQNLLNSQLIITERMEDVERRLDNEITLTSGQQRTLQQAVAKRVCSVESDKDSRRPMFQQLYREIKDRWQVASYKDVRKIDLQDALAYVAAWVPIQREGA
ncbi:Rha family transcriptional regulator [Saccharibacillus sacchari]|uniref:Rha family transcriptional regulator n=1 Tax=Saccharibacillus sacchari TaxID=456493 RepID=A0ACC6PI28_9BACL